MELGLATLADRLGWDVFALGGHHSHGRAEARRCRETPPRRSPPPCAPPPPTAPQESRA